MKSEYVTFNELMHRETGIGIDQVTNTIDAPAEWWDCKIKEHDKYMKFRGRDVSIFHNDYHNLFSRILATGFISRYPTRFSQASGTETGYGQEGLNDYRDSEPNETKGSDESDRPTRDDNMPRSASTDGLVHATSNRKRTSTGSSIGSRKKKSGSELISDSINQLVACQRDLDIQNMNINTQPKISSILECIDMIDRIDAIEKGTPLYFFAMDYISIDTNHELFAHLSTLELKFGMLQHKFYASRI
ncbi:uncharacterized protein Fot_34130 [Forsythia ovata]|uniref:Myb/SANT-like domain-containing protein n=1 Tax=Forsythia ovata TaxID=205694 RepID=A0ABD1SHT3_9LAMI